MGGLLFRSYAGIVKAALGVDFEIGIGICVG